ncbi:hypothetical protein [Tahibacter amnicola]|uniref:Uncharacterized protein n=1 Tax=Tahibacter amnicola TaxID=2976241 RepID=A0ABY6B8N0_9GAMM|nr:hypothetical protein [Tahibacter amnicola]UXI66137.1 hypothetical protein N4264_15420 [Tahibacter amnicola]
MLALLCSLLLAVPDAEELRRIDDYSGQANDLWTAAGVQPLPEATSGRELRVWAGGGVTGLWTGWIVTPTRISVYSNEIVVDGVHRPGDAYGRVYSQRRSDARGILRQFAEFAALNGSSVTCRVHDGTGYLIEGRYDGSYFAFYAGNPKLCDAPHAKEVAEALNLLWNVREDAR